MNNKRKKYSYENRRAKYQGHRHKSRRLQAAAAALLLAVTAAGCSGKNVQTPDGEEEVSIPVVLIVDSSTGIRNEETLIQEFNRIYDGKWQAGVEWIMETEEEYRQNLKRQNVTDTLPAVITDLRMLPAFYYMMIQDGRIEELSDYIYTDEEWKSMIEPSVLESCSEEDGSIYLGPISTGPSPARACSGMRSCLPGRELNRSRKHGRNSGSAVSSWKAAGLRRWRFIPKERPGRRC